MFKLDQINFCCEAGFAAECHCQKIVWVHVASAMSEQNSKPKAIIADIDGTLSYICERGVYEHEKAIDDLLNGPVHRLLCLYRQAGYRIIIVTGRTAAHGPVTAAWLRKHAVPYDEMYTRQDGDYRKDSIVKREIYDTHIGPRFTVDFVLDDRNSVVQMWRVELGLDCFQVNYSPD